MSMTATTFDRDTKAKWYARRHHWLGFGVTRIFYLPTHAEPREIRLLEVNELISEILPLEPVNHGVAIDGPDAHQLIVLEVTPAQWVEIQRDSLPLPAGWSLDDGRELEP